MPNQFFKKNKYRAKRSWCFLGHYHPSRLECEYCETLQILKKQGAIKDFEYAKKYEFWVKGKHVGNHKPDFTVTGNDGKIAVHETKGFATPDWQIRKNLFEAIYPEIPYIVIK
jgi:hypothetical protein